MHRCFRSTVTVAVCHLDFSKSQNALLRYVVVRFSVLFAFRFAIFKNVSPGLALANRQLPAGSNQTTSVGLGLFVDGRQLSFAMSLRG
jgi:hypothetical protein